MDSKELNPALHELAPGIFMVGGPDISDSRDCLCYLVNGADARVLIDCGAGPSAPLILERALKAAGSPPTHLLITHAHIDHCGGAAYVQKQTGCQLLIHPAEAEVLAIGDAKRSAADWYGLSLPPAQPDAMVDDGDSIRLGPGRELFVVHTPGHTPGSIAAWCMAGGRKVLFGQDIHGPFDPGFGSDLKAWADSMETLLSLNADVLAEGHYGVFQPGQEVQRFIQDQLQLNRP